MPKPCYDISIFQQLNFNELCLKKIVKITPQELLFN